MVAITFSFSENGHNNIQCLIMTQVVVGWYKQQSINFAKNKYGLMTIVWLHQ